MEDGNDDDMDDDDDDDIVRRDVQKQLEQMGLSKSKRKRDDEPTGKGSGSEYRSKKAGGDMKKKGKLEPYAYIPLDPKLMANRNKRTAVSKYKNVGKGRRHKK